MPINKNIQFGLPNPGSIAMDKTYTTHNLITLTVLIIFILVCLVLFYILFRFNAKRHPIPDKTSHNTVLEIIWTVIPLVIIIIILVPSLTLLKLNENIPHCDLHIKIIAHQWYWSYNYSDYNINFDSYMLQEEDLQQSDLRLLSVDKPLYLPINTNIKLHITSDDVIHSWGVPKFGIKTDAIPGILNETWVNITKEGTYYGQCFELCGILHGFMPIEIKAIKKENFQQWIKQNNTQ